MSPLCQLRECLQDSPARETTKTKEQRGGVRWNRPSNLIDSDARRVYVPYSLPLQLKQSDWLSEMLSTMLGNEPQNKGYKEGEAGSSGS